MDSNNRFRVARNQYIRKMLELTLQENQNHVESHLKQLKKSHRECQSCFKVFTNLKRKCDNCSGVVIKKTFNHSRITLPQDWKVEKHFDLGQAVSRNDSIIQTGEPILVNPNSYDSIREIISTLKSELGIGSQREWVILGCDGPP